MHKSMEILMSRMDSHPVEFDVTFSHTKLNYRSRWEFILKPLMERAEAMMRGEPSFMLGFLSDKEVGLVFQKLMTVQGDACTHMVMNELLRDERGLREVEFGGGIKPYVAPMTVPTEETNNN